MVKVEITRRYSDIELNQKFDAGVTREVTEDRAKALVDAGVATILEIVPEKKKRATKKDSSEKAEKKSRKGYTRKK